MVVGGEIVFTIGCCSEDLDCRALDSMFECSTKWSMIYDHDTCAGTRSASKFVVSQCTVAYPSAAHPQSWAAAESGRVHAFNVQCKYGPKTDSSKDRCFMSQREHMWLSMSASSSLDEQPRVP